MVDETKEWPEWTDRLGNVYKPGDDVAYAASSGSSAILVIGEVVKINKVDSKGKPHEILKWDDGDLNLKMAFEAAQTAYYTFAASLGWDDPVRVDYMSALDRARRDWEPTRTRVSTPTATVAIREKNSGGSYSTIKNLYNIIKI